jgi:hypothetical protein
MFLYVFGGLFYQYFTDKQFKLVYFLGGSFGAFFFILFYNLFPAFSGSIENSAAIGASAAVIAIAAAITAYIPNYEIKLMFIGNVKLIYLILFLLVVDIISIPSGNAGGHISHLGGALLGFLYTYQIKNGNTRQYSKTTSSKKWKNPLNDFINKRKQENAKKQAERAKDKAVKNHQKQIKEILKKVSEKGYASLSDEEKEIFFKHN